MVNNALDDMPRHAGPLHDRLRLLLDDAAQARHDLLDLADRMAIMAKELGDMAREDMAARGHRLPEPSTFVDPEGRN